MSTLTEQAIKLLFKDTAFQYDLVYSTFFFSNKKGGLEIHYPGRGPRPFTCMVSSDKNQYVNTEKEQEAYDLLVKAKESGELDHFFLAICLFNGFGVKANKKEAIHLLEQGNDAICLYVLGYCYENKIVVGKDQVKALEYYQNAFDRGSVDACNVLLSYLKGKDKKKTASWQSKANELFKKINDSNDMVSIRKVVEICGDGTLSYGGVRIPNLCKKGAKLGDAYCKLAYAMNSSVDSDLRKRCVDELCNKDYLPAFLSYGHSLLFDNNINESGFSYLSRAYKNYGSLDAIFFMGEAYLNLKKYKEAEEAFLTIVNSADLCFSKTLLFQAKCFLSDIYFATNKFQELIKLTESVEDECLLTKEWNHYLGEVYENGFSEPKDYEKALSFYLKELTAQPKSLGSAFGGQCDSYKTPIKIAGWLEKGEVVQQDISRALSIYDWVVNELDFWLSRNVTVRLNKPVRANLTYLKGLAKLGQDVTHSEKWDASKKEYIQWYVDGRDTMYHVAELYEIRGEIKKAVDDYSLSALYGNRKACIKLIDMYEKGIAPKREGHSAEAWKEYLEYLNS